MPIIPVHTETEAGRLLEVIGQCGIHSKFQVSTSGGPVSKKIGRGVVKESGESFNFNINNSV